MSTLDGFFVTGTDTGVGKTVVCAAILAALRGAGYKAVPAKPVQTGAAGGRSHDLDFCLRIANCPADEHLYDILSPYRFRLPASPHLAARDEGKRIDVSRIVEAHGEIRRRGLVPIFEGAGGLMVPLDDQHLMIDLIRDLALPAILVARPSLGTLNHTLLSAEALRTRGITIAAVVLNELSEDWGRIEDDNLATLRRRLRDTNVERFPHLAADDARAVLRAGQRLLDALGVR